MLKKVYKWLTNQYFLHLTQEVTAKFENIFIVTLFCQETAHGGAGGLGSRELPGAPTPRMPQVEHFKNVWNNFHTHYYLTMS